MNCIYMYIFFLEFKKFEMNEMELNLIPLWELIIERSFLVHINYTLNNDISQDGLKYHSFIKSLLYFVPTVAPFYFTALNDDYNKSFTIKTLMEALNHSMNSVAVENPKLYLNSSSRNINLENHDETTNEVFYIIKKFSIHY